MASYRIQTNIIDRSQVALADSTITGAMVVRGSKGPSTPVYIAKGDTDRLIALFGSPGVTSTQTYNDVWEAIQFNNQEGLWVVSPYTTATDKFGGAMVTQYGTVPLATGWTDSGMATPVFSDNYINTYTEAVITCNGTQGPTGSEITYTLSNATIAPLVSNFYLYLNGVQQSISISTTPFKITSAGMGLNTNLSSFDLATRVLSLNFTAAPVAGTRISVKYTSPTATGAQCYYSIMARSPYTTDDLAVKTSYNATQANWVISLYKNINSSLVLLDDYAISFTMNAKDGFGKSIYYADVLLDNDYIIVKPNASAQAVSTGSVNDTVSVAMYGGTRTTPSNITAAMMCTAWDNFKKKSTYPAQIFMSTMADLTIVQAFDTLRNTYQIYAKYILPLPQSGASTAAISTKSGYSVNNRGLRFYWNWGLVRTTYGSFWTPLVGRVGVKHAQMKTVFFGKAPAWIDENGLGGQLGPGVVQLAYDPTEDELQALDTAGINPIIFDNSYGIMIVSQKTAQNPALISDTSYIGHSDVIDYIFENVTNQVLTAQICKLNDPYHRELVKSKAYQLTDPIVQTSVLQECKHKCDEGNNTPSVMSARKFILTTAIKVTPFSERIVFNLIATEQSVSLSQVLG